MSEQESVLKALKMGIEMEKDGQECYRQALHKTGNDVGRKLLQALAVEEESHLRHLTDIYASLQKNGSWPDVPFSRDSSETPGSIFAHSCQITGVDVEAIAGEFEALDVAVKKEKKSYDFYRLQSQKASDKNAAEFFKALAGEEREHELALLNYYEYLTDPVDWLTVLEHHSLDGG